MLFCSLIGRPSAKMLRASPPLATCSQRVTQACPASTLVVCRRRVRVEPVHARKKGFKSTEPAQQQAAGLKANELGQVPSGPGQLSKQPAESLLEGRAIGQQQAVVEQPIAPLLPEQQQQPPVGRDEREAFPIQPGSLIQETPQVVVDRMLVRMLVCMGSPMLLGVSSLVFFWWLKVVEKVDYPFWVVYICQGIAFGGALLGISYGVLSTSWDPRREGSFWGWDEFRANLPILLKRGKNS